MRNKARMMLPRDVPPTAGLPVMAKDFLPGHDRLDDVLMKLLGIPQPIMCSSGTSALIVGLKTLAKNSKRDTVIVTAFSCPLVVIAIAHCGLNVTLCDTAPDSFDFDFEQLTALASERTLAIISTHLAGKWADVAHAKRIADAVGAYVIEDAAQSLGATINEAGESVGLVGDVAFFSLSVGKGLTTYAGGILFTRDPVLQQKLTETALALQPASPLSELKRSIQFIAYFLFYRPLLLPYVYGMQYRHAVAKNDWITALGERFGTHIPMHTLGAWRQNRAANAAKRLPEYLRKTGAQAEKRVAALEAEKRLTILKNTNGARTTWPFIMILFPDLLTRDAALTQLNGLGLGVTRLYAYALNEYDYLKPHLSASDKRPGAFPAAKDFSERLLTLSNSLALTDAQFGTIMGIITSVLK